MGVSEIEMVIFGLLLSKSRQTKEEYSDSETDLANMPLNKFYSSMEKIFQQAKKILKKNGYIAVIISPSQVEGEIYDHAIVFYKMLEKIFTFENRIIVPYPTQQISAANVEMAKKNKFLLKLYRDLLVFKNV